jgi:hypothetical protein
MALLHNELLFISQFDRKPVPKPFSISIQAAGKKLNFGLVSQTITIA